MQFHYSPEPQNYDGTQLRSHFIYETWDLLGDACVAFTGPCQVSLEQMVDLEDVKGQAPIAADHMLHLLVEHFQWDLSTGVVWQRLMVALLGECLQDQGVTGLRRKGNDLYWEQKKLNVSVATASPLSTLIHLGVNTNNEGTPVSTAALSDWGLNPKDFAQKYLTRLEAEYRGFQRARWKVRAVR